MSAAGELRTQVLGSEIRGVTAARREGLAGIVRTLTFTVGVRWCGQASEGSEQRRECFILVVTGYFLAAEGEARRRAISRPHTGVCTGSILGCGQTLVCDGDTGPALQGPSSLSGLKETPKGSGWV